MIATLLAALLLTASWGRSWSLFESPPSNMKPLTTLPEPESIGIGPSGNQWLYSSDTKSYDLTRGNTRSEPFGFATTEGTTNVTVVIAPELTVLVVIDMQNFFLHPSCNNHPLGIAAAQKTMEVIKICREVGIKVIWLNWGLTDRDLNELPAAQTHSFGKGLANPPSSPLDKRCSFGCDLGDGKGRMLMQDSWNSQLFEPLQNVTDPRTDKFIHKNRVSGLWNDETPFAQALLEGKYQTLLFAGVNTNQCVLGTLLDSYYRGYDSIVIEDSCATSTPGGQDVPILDVWRNYGFVTNSAALRAGRTGKSRRY